MSEPLFPNGTSAVLWKMANCDRCFRGHDAEADRYSCEMEEAIDGEWLGGDPVPPSIRARIFAAPHRCGEFVRLDPVEAPPDDPCP
jgi:hypothetical protein